MAGVSLVIPTYNRCRYLRGAIASCFALKIPDGVSAELLIVDNNSTDDTTRIVLEQSERSPYPLRQVVEIQQGLCFARNRCLAEALYEQVIFLDDDIEVSADWILGYWEAIERFDADCVVGPVFPSFECALPPYLTSRVLDSITSAYSRKGIESMLLSPAAGHEIPGCNFGVKKSVALSLKGFDPELDRKKNELLAGGDFEFGQRLVRAGKRIVYQPRCAVRHLVSAEKMSRPSLKKRWYGLGATRAIMEKKEGVGFSLLRKFGAACRVLWFALTVLGARLVASEGTVFQGELELLRAWGFLKTSLLRNGRYGQGNRSR